MRKPKMDGVQEAAAAAALAQAWNEKGHQEFEGEEMV